MSWKKLLKEAGPGAAPPPSLPAAAIQPVVAPLAGPSGAAVGLRAPFYVFFSSLYTPNLCRADQACKPRDFKWEGWRNWILLVHNNMLETS